MIINATQLPNFLLIGANKAGTTSIYHYLQQHPEIGMASIKEPMFFTAHNTLKSAASIDSSTLNQPFFIRDLTQYQQLFVGHEHKLARGECSTAYLPNPHLAVPRIKALCPDMKIIVCLRHPIARAYSNYLMYYGDGLETRSFEQAVIDEMAGHLHKAPTRGAEYLRLSLYAQSLNAYVKAFGRWRVLVLRYDDLQRTPLVFMKRIFRFLSVDDSFTPNVRRRFNSNKQWLSQTEKPQMSPYAAAQCQQYFAKDLS